MTGQVRNTLASSQHWLVSYILQFSSCILNSFLKLFSSPILLGISQWLRARDGDCISLDGWAFSKLVGNGIVMVGLFVLTILQGLKVGLHKPLATSNAFNVFRTDGQHWSHAFFSCWSRKAIFIFFKIRFLRRRKKVNLLQKILNLKQQIQSDFFSAVFWQFSFDYFKAT